MTRTLVLLLVYLCCAQYVRCKRYCYTNDDCADLGSLVCMRSMCEAGVCGCPRGQVARFIGSVGKYACVTIRMIGEQCSTDHTEGVCGAENSQCVNGICECDTASGYESRWGGEACLLVKNELESTESCSGGIGAGSLTCERGFGWGPGYSAGPLQSLPDHPLDGVPNLEACSTPQQTNLLSNFHDSEYMGGFRPACESLKVGDVCLSDDDCADIQEPDTVIAGNWVSNGGHCDEGTRTCQCNTATYVHDITGMYCADALGYGTTCTAGANNAVGSDVGICDGTVGLRCGDPCDQSMIDDTNTRHLTCQCDPGWLDVGGSCDRNTVGGQCYGDYNCKSIGPDAVCENLLCAETVTARVRSEGSQVNSVPPMVCFLASTLVWLTW